MECGHIWDVFLEETGYTVPLLVVADIVVAFLHLMSLMRKDTRLILSQEN